MGIIVLQENIYFKWKLINGIVCSVIQFEQKSDDTLKRITLSDKTSFIRNVPCKKISKAYMHVGETRAKPAIIWGKP